MTFPYMMDDPFHPGKKVEAFDVEVSNRTPEPWEVITIGAHNFDARRFWAFEDHEIVALLIMDDEEIARTDVHIWREDYGDYRGDFSFTIGAPGVPGPYTYRVWFFSKRDGHRLDGEALVGIEVVPKEEEERKERIKRCLLMSVIGLEIGGMVQLFRGGKA